MTQVNKRINPGAIGLPCFWLFRELDGQIFGKLVAWKEVFNPVKVVMIVLPPGAKGCLRAGSFVRHICSLLSEIRKMNFEFDLPCKFG